MNACGADTARPDAPWLDAPWLDGAEPLLHTLTRRRGLPLMALRVDRRLVALNGDRLRTPGTVRPAPKGLICAVAYRVELRPTLRETLAHLADPRARVRLRRPLLGTATVEGAEAQAAQDTHFALATAVAAAARRLGHPVEVTGRGIRVDAVRSRSRLQPGDRIVAEGGTPVTTLEEFLPRLEARDVATVTVRPGRPGTAVERDELLTRGDDGRWGLRISTDRARFTTPLDVRFDLPPDLGGSSVGLAAALAVVDAFTGGALSRHGHVVATGTVTHAGDVGEVSGLDLKARAVREHPRVGLLLVPPIPAVDLTRLRRIVGCATVAPVAHLDEAVDLLTERGGRTPAPGREIVHRQVISLDPTGSHSTPGGGDSHVVHR